MSASPRLRLRVSAPAESHLRAGHPWLYEGSVREQNREGEAGELAVVYDRRDRFLAIGLYDPHSPLRLRVLHVGLPVTVDETWWSTRLDTALLRRASLFGPDTDGYRMVNGESDGFPGLVLDRYADTLVLKVYTAAWFPHLPLLLGLLETRFPGFRAVLRLSRNIEGRAEAAGLRDGQTLVGEEPGGPVIFCETGLRFEADVVRGQKTGFFSGPARKPPTGGGAGEGAAGAERLFLFGGLLAVCSAGRGKGSREPGHQRPRFGRRGAELRPQWG